MSSAALRRLNGLTGNVFSDPSLHTVPSSLLVTPSPTSSDASQAQTKGFDHFAHVKEAPPDEIFNTGIRYRADKDPKKVDLGVGAYRTDEGKPLVLSVVRKAEAVIAADKSLNKEYLGIDGDPTFVRVARELLFGSDSPALIGNRVASAQGISGTGSVRVGLDFIAKFLPKVRPCQPRHSSLLPHPSKPL